MIRKAVLLGLLLVISFTEDAHGLKCYKCDGDCVKETPVETTCTARGGVEAIGCQSGLNKDCYYADSITKCFEGAKHPADDPGKERCTSIPEETFVKCLIPGGIFGRAAKQGEAVFCVCKKDLCNTGGKMEGTTLGIVGAVILVQLAVFN